MFIKLKEVFRRQFHFKRKIIFPLDHTISIICRQALQLADENVSQVRRDQYCIYVPGRPPLTNAQAAREIIEQAKLLLQQDLKAMGFGSVIQKPPNDNKSKVFYQCISILYCGFLNR